MTSYLQTRLRGILTILVLFLATQAALAQQFTVREGEGRALELPLETETVFIADPLIADAQAISPSSIFVTGYAPGETTIILNDINDREIAQYNVVVQPSGAGAGALLGQGLNAREGRQVAIISGSTDSVEGAQSVTSSRRAYERNDVTVQDNSTYRDGTQISLRVRFIEASRNDLQRLGVDVAALGSGPLRVVAGGVGDPAGGLGEGLGGLAVGGTATAGRYNIDALIDMLEERGSVQILAEPTLTTVSGRRASFQAGGEIAYPVNQGNNVITAAFREYGVSIDFLPTLLPNNRIAIEVKPEVSVVDRTNSVVVEGFQVPGLSVRRVDTTVEVASGQTFAIAGLYEQFSENTSRGVPGMSQLLGKNSRNRRERELMIFITPFIADAKDVAAPRAARKAPRATVGFITR
ncbi:type II and III secretion system protein family protein [Paracoccus sp. (in: a-proteobacteria)]|uniref:type II and III secretion system protein family protein n=1 Tax=Paracoccus sp. TaxID=267 RepID=UPI003A88F72C